MEVLQTIQNYVDDCLSGKIPVCEQIRFACERHKRDLTREDIYFDEAAASRVVKFIQLMKHVKGEWAGKFIKLEPWQIFFVGSVFGWKWKDSGLRRFREANLTIPRKNGKTLLAVAIDQYMLTEDREPGADVILAASKEEQAKELFGVALSMSRSNPEFIKYYGLELTTETIRCKKYNSSYKFIIGKPADGGNPHAAHIEEAHEHKSGAAYEVLKNGMGSRRQPLLYIASTAGSDFKSFYYQHLEYCRKVVSGVIEDDTLFSLEYTIDKDDNWEDFKVWVKANPNMNVSVYEAFLRSQHKKALEKVDSRTDILTKHLNVWNNSSTAWIDFRKWKMCVEVSLKLEDFKGKKCWVGLDLASRVDLCSLIFVFKNGDEENISPNEEFTVFGKHYINREKADLPENQHYRTWEAEGWLTVTEGAETDFTAIEDDLKAFNENFVIEELAYDPREAGFLMQTIREWAGFDCVQVSQSPISFSEPMKVLEAAYLTKQIHFPDDPVLNWAAANVILKKSSNKLFYPAKRTKEEKIDPIVALIMALSRAKLAETPADFSIFVL